MGKNGSFSGDAVEAWISTLRGDTARTYGAVLRALSSEHNPLLCSSARLERFVKGAATMRMRQRRVSAMHRFYRYALNEGLIDKDPSRNIYLRNLGRPSTAELLHQIGAGNDIAVCDLLKDHMRGRRLRWASEAGKELLNRLYGKISTATSPANLIAALRSRARLIE